MKLARTILLAIVAIALIGCLAGVEVDVNTSVYVKVGGWILEWIR